MRTQRANFIVTTKDKVVMSKKTEDAKAVEKLGKARDAIVSELRKSIVGMDDVIDEMMIAIFARGHCLLVGVPGLAKTVLVSSLAERAHIAALPALQNAG